MTRYCRTDGTVAPQVAICQHFMVTDFSRWALWPEHEIVILVPSPTSRKDDRRKSLLERGLGRILPILSCERKHGVDRLESTARTA
jgi:hypothetical protein